MNLPLFEAILTNDSDGIFAISLVDEPATESEFQFFSKEDEVQLFSVQNEEEQLISGVIMLADTPIYRKGQNGDGYYIIYHKEVLKQMAEKLLADGKMNQIDIMHDQKYIDGFKMVELYIKDSAKGIVPSFLENVPDGSLIGTYHIEDKELFESVKQSGLKGFSLEGYFHKREEQFNKANNKSNKTRKNMSILKTIKKMLMSFSSISTDKGILSYDGEEDIKIGDEVYTEGEDGAKLPVEDGEYTTEDGKIIVVADSHVAEVREVEAEEEPAAEEEMKKKECMEDEEPAAEEEKPAEEPVEEPAEPEYDAKAEIEALKAEIEAIKASIAEIAQKPAVEPIEEQFEKLQELNDKKTPNLYRR